jgi:hypothetical protein
MVPRRKRLLTIIALAALFQFGAQAGPVSEGIWYEYVFSNGSPDPANNVPTMACSAFEGCPIDPPFDVVWADDPPWLYIASQESILRVTDVAVAGDSYNVFDFGALILSTPSVDTSGTYVCGVSDTDYIDPAVCVKDPLMSHGQVVLGVGPHSITIEARESPYGGGIGDFIIVPIPEPSTMLLLGSVLVLLGGARRAANRRKQALPR